MKDRIFVAYKPSGIGSNKFLSQLKRKYGIKKAGFSGTLDPFAKGVLVVAFGRFTRLFSHLKKTPKVYRATLWLGASSETLDIDSPVTTREIPPFTPERILQTLQDYIGVFTYSPPKYCAKRVDGQRAYDLARKGEAVNLKEVSSTIYDITLLNYVHPFVTFEAAVSEGTYIRSLGAYIASSLGTTGILSMLERLREGVLVYEDEKPLAPLEIVDAKPNRYFGESADIDLGKKIALDQLANTQTGKYIIQSEDNFAIIAVTNENEVDYLLNRVPKC